jgi:hypothetical protein
MLRNLIVGIIFGFWIVYYGAGSCGAHADKVFSIRAIR